MMFKFGERSEKNLIGVHPDLIAVCRRALQITYVDFMITDGLRTPEEQAILIKKGKSWTMDSRHITGHAIDVAAIVRGAVSWDYELYEKIAEAFKSASLELKIPIKWGGDFISNKGKPRRDGPHFELDRRKYT